MGRFDLRAILSGTGVRSPAQMMMLDQLLRVIASDPMSPSEDENDQDPMLQVSSGGLKGSDWADVMSKHLIPTPRPPAVRRAYAEPSPGPQALNDTL